MSSNITTLNRKKGNIKAQITKLSNWKETNDPSDIAAHLTVLEKLQKKFDDLKTEYFESATDEEILEIEISLAEMDSDIQDLEWHIAAQSLLVSLVNRNIIRYFIVKLALRGQRSQDPSPDREKQTESSKTPSEEGNSSQGVTSCFALEKKKNSISNHCCLHFRQEWSILDSGSMETVFGYICTSAIEGSPETQHCGLLTQENTMEETLRKFWEVESVLDELSSKSKEIEREGHFLNTYQRDESGKFVVRLPIKENSELREPLGIANRRFNSLRKCLHSNCVCILRLH
ncbi:DUF1758 domain-containing protein [Nephila pilipes]|uniref:DUF1758 domain-containing protein n=2 Tax=Nephila pilipes TaxID=299642 RepID=A0A8X6MFB4_NEPPI|nr:DUF1758 domain-containing protein [Nephila pilipes]